MERGPLEHPAAQREDAMILLKSMVLMCILCVVATLYAEYRRMKKFEGMLKIVSAAQTATIRPYAHRTFSAPGQALQGQGQADGRLSQSAFADVWASAPYAQRGEKTPSPTARPGCTPDRMRQRPSPPVGAAGGTDTADRTPTP